MHDNDTSGYLGAAFLIAAEQQRQANNEAEETNARNRELAQQANDLEHDLQRQSQQSREVEDDYWGLFNLLKQPMNVIASRNAFFATTFEASQSELAELKLNELSFIELAIQLGSKIGMSREAVIRKAARMRPDVLRNTFPKENGTNATFSPLLQQRGPAMLHQYDTERTAFIEKYQGLLKSAKLYDILDVEVDNWSQFLAEMYRLGGQSDIKAAYNIGYCLCYGIGSSSNLEKAAKWLTFAHQRGETKSIMVLHYLHAFNGSQYDAAKADYYIDLAEQQGNTYAAKRRAEWEKEKQSIRWTREEPELLQKLLVVTPGRLPAELEKIRGRGYIWEEAAIVAHSCEYKLIKGETVNFGTFFSPKKKIECFIEVTNPTEFPAVMHPELIYDRKKYGTHMYEDGYKTPVVEANRKTKVFVGRYDPGVLVQGFIAKFYDPKKHQPLLKFENICSGLRVGSLIFMVKSTDDHMI